MAKTTAENKPGHITRGNVLADLGFTAEEIRETEIKMTIWRPLREEIESRDLTQADVAEQLRIHQPDASVLMRGKLAKFSVMKLAQFAERLGLTVRLIVEPAPKARHRRIPRSRSSTVASRRKKNAPAKKVGARARAVS